jgi:hypothetical protein
MDLSLNAAELEHLGALGVTVGADGSMRSASGRQVSPGTAVEMLARRDIEPQDYDRGWIYPEHQEPSPGDEPGNNPNAPDAPASAVYGSGASAYARNQRAIATERYAPSQYNMSEPAACRQVALPADMRASAVPQAAQALATRPAPGEC